MRTRYNYDYERYSPYFEMVYNYEGDILKMTPKTFLMWLNTFSDCDVEQKNNFIKNLKIFINGEEEVR